MIAGLSPIWYGLLAYLLAGAWVSCWVTNMEARCALRDEERIRREIIQAGARDLDLANPDNLR